MKIINRVEKYPYLEMARVGITEDNMDIIVRTDDPGKLPHFHIIDRNRIGERNNEGCIRIDKPEYFSHGNKTMTLNTSQRKLLVKFLNDKPIDGVFENNWQLIRYMWNLNNSNVKLPQDIEMPDYTLLA